jgi:hypothetical protein
MDFNYYALLKPILSDHTIDIIRNSDEANSPPTNRNLPPQRIGRQIQNIILSGQQVTFPKTLTFEDTSFILTEDMYSMLKLQYAEVHTNLHMTKSRYSREEISNKFKNIILAELPKELAELDPVPVIQTVTLPGNGLIPHTDNIRTASLFYLLDAGGDWNTTWYSAPDPITESVKHGFFWGFAEWSRLTTGVSATLKSNQWYLFDNLSYHSVIGYKNCSNRIALGIEFRTGITAIELYKLLETLHLTQGKMK